MKILTILAQKINNTGSGIVVKEFIKTGQRFGDVHYLLDLDYHEGYETEKDIKNRTTVFASQDNEMADLDFPIPGMSDVMPYKSIKYSELTSKQIKLFLNTFRSKIDAIISNFKPEIIHIHHLWILFSLAKYFSIPTVVTIHGTDIKLLETTPNHFKKTISNNINYVKHFFSISSHYCKAAKRIYNIPSNRISVIGNGYNSHIFKIKKVNKHDNAHSPIILFAGKFVPWKGIKYLIRACAKIRQTYTLVIAGSGSNLERDLLEKEAMDNNIDPSKIFVGHLTQEKLSNLMSRAKVFVLPSINEPFGLVILEAMACGCPIITSNSGGPPEFIPKKLIKLNLAELIPPLNKKTKMAEDVYVDNLKNAIENKLLKIISLKEKRLIHNSIKNLTWNNYYLQIRNKYQEYLH